MKNFSNKVEHESGDLGSSIQSFKEAILSQLVVPAHERMKQGHQNWEELVHSIKGVGEDDGLTLQDWENLATNLGLSFEEELQEAVVQEFGERAGIHLECISEPLGINPDHYYVVVFD